MCTLVPEGQYTSGRKCTSSGANQCQPPFTGGVAVTWSRLTSSACRSAGIDVLKRRIIGIPTPTTSPSLGVAAVSNRRARRVVKLVRVLAVSPPVPRAVAEIV